MRLCILWGKQIDETFENTQRRKVKQMQPMWLCILSGRQLEDTFENAHWTKVKTHTTSSTMHPMRQAIWGDIWKDSEGKGPTWRISYFTKLTHHNHVHLYIGRHVSHNVDLHVGHHVGQCTNNFLSFISTFNTVRGCVIIIRVSFP